MPWETGSPLLVRIVLHVTAGKTISTLTAASDAKNLAVIYDDALAYIIRSTMVGWRAFASGNAAPERCTERAQFTAPTRRARWLL
jgi:hypothetical protein